MRRTILGCAVLMLGVAGCKFFHHEPGPVKLKVFETPMGPRPGEDQHARAGHPNCVSRCAHPSTTCAYTLYPVGGGEAFRHKGEGPTLPDEGVWGWDYSGRVVKSNVELLWSHGRYQGGFGSYKTFGPNLQKKVHERNEKHESHEGGHGEGGGGHGAGNGHGGGNGHGAGNGHGGGGH